MKPTCYKGRGCRGLTIIEVLVVIGIILLIVLILLPAMGSRNRPGAARQIRDAANIRAFHQSMVIFANNNKDAYPLPSVLDWENSTVAEERSAKNVTANVLSILIYQNAIAPEMCVSPAEVNPNIAFKTDYQYNAPKAAVDPSKALWDPSFAADFSRPGANQSYAHIRPLVDRADRPSIWKNTFNATEPVFGNRGPEVASVGIDPKSRDSRPTLVNTKSNTLLIHGGRRTWEGFIAYNDSHVNFETKTAPDGVTYPTSTAPSKSTADNLFYDEPDDVGGQNAYLSTYIKAGDEKSDFVPIWD